MNDDKTLFLQPEDFNPDRKHKIGENAQKKSHKVNDVKKQELKAEKPSVYEDSKVHKQQVEKKIRSRRKLQWNSLMGYHNRKVRGQFRDKNDKKRSALEISSEITPLEKWAQVTIDNIKNGALLHDSFVNDMVQLDMDRERAMEERVKKSLKEFYGNTEKAMRAFTENKRLQNILTDKKLAY